MKTGLAISLFFHTGALAFLFLVGFESPARIVDPLPDEINVELVSESEFVSLSTPVPIVEPAPEPSTEIDHYQLPEQVQEEQEVLPEIRQALDFELGFDAPQDSPELLTDVAVATDLIQAAEISSIDSPADALELGIEEGVASQVDLHNIPRLDEGESLNLPESPRVDTTVSPAPPTELKIADELKEASIAEASDAAEEVPLEDESAAPEEATLRIVTEANQSEELSSPLTIEKEVDLEQRLLALGQPILRPLAIETVDQATPQEEEATASLDIDQVILQDVIEQNSEVASSNVSAKTPELNQRIQLRLTKSELDEFSNQIKQAWNVGTLSSEGLHAIVTVRFNMSHTGRPSNIRLIDGSGASDDTIQRAFEAASRAINIGLEKGHNLPRDKYDMWKEIELTFNPEEMRKL